MGRKKKEIEIKTKKATTKTKKTKEVVEVPTVSIVPTEIEEEKIETAPSYTTASTKTIVDEIREEAIKETFKENNTRLIDRMFGYSWNGQEMDY